jgi:hypothetical protein
MLAFATPSTWEFGQSADSYGFAPGEHRFVSPYRYPFSSAPSESSLAIVRSTVGVAQNKKPLSASPGRNPVFLGQGGDSTKRPTWSVSTPTKRIIPTQQKLVKGGYKILEI